MMNDENKKKTMKKIFISYSHKDAEFKDKLVKQLGVLHLAGLCSIWEDGQIPTGTDWNQGIEKAIEEADVAVLLVSEGFLNSRFINETEVPLILERKDKGELTVLPLFIKPCEWKNVPWLSKIQGFPSNGKPLSRSGELEQLEILTQFAGTIASYVKISPPPTTRLFTQLPPRKIKLIGREKDLSALAEMLKKSERVVLVNGLGGIGKTEVCKSFFYTHYNEYVYAAWIDWISTFRESLVNALGGDKSTFIQAAETDTRDDRFDKIMARLRCVQETFLLVVDNIENPGDADLDALASLPSAVKVLVNSRNYIEGYEVRNLDYLSKEECRALFYEFYKGKPDNADDETVDRVVELCGYHTLTVELLAKTAVHAGMGEETRLYLHPVMQEVVKYRARPDAKKCKVLIGSLANKLFVEPGGNPIFKKEYIPYGEAVVRALAMEAEEKDEALATLANNLSTIHLDMGQLDRAMEFQLKAVAIMQFNFPNGHPKLDVMKRNLEEIKKVRR